jgi:hypothetical protein
MYASSAAFISFAYTLTIIYLALSANLSVEIVSSILSIIGDAAAIKVVLVLPPSESYNNLVIFESLYGMCCAFFP